MALLLKNDTKVYFSLIPVVPIYSGNLMWLNIIISGRMDIHLIIININFNIFKLEIEISTFILPNQSYGALCITDREKIKIFIYSGLVENFTLDEIRFVVAHEIGHQIFNHVPLNIAEITTSNMLMNRCQEISADRIGFFAIKDLSVVGQTIMKLLSGLSSKHLTKNFLPIFRQAKDFRNLDESSTHPNLSLRLGAIIEFSMSKEYNLLCENKDKGSFSLEDVDKRIYQKIKNLDGEDFKKALYDQLNSFNN